MKCLTTPLAAALVLAGCDASPEQVATEFGNKAGEVLGSDTVETINSTAAEVIDGLSDNWAGTWFGPEGTSLTLKPGAGEDVYQLTIVDLDGPTRYEARRAQNKITFMRDGKPESIRRASGDETGMKWLAGKKKCLMTKPGEGWCRD